MNSNSRNNSVSILSDEASALLRREEKYCSDVFDEDEKAPHASSISTPPHRSDHRERMSSPVCIANDISGHFDEESRGKVCDWMYRVSKIRQQVIYVIIVSSLFVRTVFLMFHLTNYFCDTLSCYITPFNRLSNIFH